jgi:predicted permease
MTFLLQDLRHATRSLVKAPGFAFTVVLTLTLGIGATVVIITFAYDVMLKPLPFADADRIVTINEKVAEWSNLYSSLPVSANHFTFWQEHNRSFDSMAIMGEWPVPLGAFGHAQQVEALLATPGIFQVLRVQPMLGRTFTAAETQPGHETVAILSDDLWREQFGGDKAALGKTILVDGFPYSVIGVMPPDFHMPSIGTSSTIGSSRRDLPVRLLAPLKLSKERLAEEMGDLNYFGFARLKPGESVTVAGAELNALQHTIAAKLPADEKATLSAEITPFKETLVGNNRRPLIILLGAVVGLLLVGCVNVTNLLLGRAVSRRQQTAVIAALGAGRFEIMRVALRETIVLVALGGGLGVALAAVIVPVMQRYLPPALDIRGPLHLDWVGVGCALLLSVLVALAAGAAPVFMVSRTAPQEALQSSSRLSGESSGSLRARRVLVATEAAVSVALVLLTGLMAASLMKLMKVDRGFTTERTITATIHLPSESFNGDQKRAAFYRELLERLNALPGAEHAAFTSILPLTGNGWGDAARPAGESRPGMQLPLENFRSVSPQYFPAIGLPIVAGKAFGDGDWGKNLALVSQRTAKALWPGKDPLGQQFSRGDPATEKPFTIVGVVADARTISLDEPDPMLIYVPYWYRVEPAAGVVVRTRQDPSGMAAMIRNAIWSIDRNVPIPDVRMLGGVVADSVANRRFQMDLLLLFALSAVLLATLGIYGVTTYSVVQRQREIGLRIALGAQKGNVYALVLREGLAPVVAGSLAGVGFALAAAHLLRSLLFEVSPYDPLLVSASVGLLLCAGIAACLLPASRAVAVDPMKVLRAE